ncbi:MAG: hypothetical protein JKX95_06395 [Bacteroidia bacterium]|nr:hypothetical protein [Bacteroidia bacterium]
MKQLLVLSLFVFIVFNTQAQYSKGSVEEMKKFKNADKIYVKLMNEKGHKFWSEAANPLFKNAIEKDWTMNSYEFLTYDEWRQKIKDKSLRDKFVLELEMKDISGGKAFTLKINLFPTTKSTAELFVTNEMGGAGAGESLAKMLNVYVKAIQRYINTCIELNKTDPVEVAKSNYNYLKERKLYFFEYNLSSYAKKIMETEYKYDYEVLTDANTYMGNFTSESEKSAIYIKNYVAYYGVWYDMIIEPVEGRILYYQKAGRGLSSMSKLSEENAKILVSAPE